MAVALTSIAERAVATAGTAVPLVSAPVSNAIKAYITVPSSNTGSIFIGDSGVSTTEGIEIPKGTTFVLDAPQNELLDLASIYANAGTNGDKFKVTYFAKIS